MTVLIRIIGPFSEVLDTVRSLEAADILHDKEFVAEHYGRLSKTWKNDVKAGFDECFRVLKPLGFLNFKWSETEISLSEVTPLFPIRPMYYNRQGLHGSWFMFRKPAVMEGGE